MTWSALVGRRWRVFALVVSGIVGLFVGFSSLGQVLEQALLSANAQIRTHRASGSLHIVEIDAGSIAAIDRWPWPRRNYAQVVDRLRQAGAASIAFDVDFSSYANAQDDAAFAAALGRAGNKVILPTFGQRTGGGRHGWTDSLPIPPLRDHSTLAAVNIVPERDGMVRRAPVGTMTDGLPRPSLSAIIAGMDGAVDSDFPIDFAIDPASIPRHSFIDIRDGRFDPREIAGKDILIGATAIEMGDRYAVPDYGVIPGVVVQALAAETLKAGMPREGGWVLPLLFALNCAWLILHMRNRHSLLAAVVAAPLMLFALSVATTSLSHCVFAIVPAFAALASASGCKYAMRLLTAARHRRSHDLATGLPNRFALRSSVSPAGRSGIVAARFVDYDKLATGLGDKATAGLVRRVRDRVQLIAEGSAIFRVEDRVLAWHCASEHLEDRLATLRTMMLNPVEVEGRRVDVTLAFGFALQQKGQDNGRTLSRAMLAADQALEHGESWRIHDAQEAETVDRELSLLGELDEAIARGEIEVHYQPKLCLKTNTITSVEALVRWNHRTRGRLGPDLFIPLAERHDRIGKLTLHVLEQTIRNLQAWQAHGYCITGAVNLSAKLLMSAEFLSKLRDMVEHSGVLPHMLAFEVTESAAMTDAKQAATALTSFQAMGIAISVDDYGTGQSTLSYLRQLPLNELKIDRSFVQFAHENRSDGVLVQSTINLAHELGLKVVAEGVEDQECMAFLRAVGCDMIQGYLISRPIPSDELLELLRHPFAAAA